MRIIKTSAQAADREERMQKALEQMEHCPECGAATDRPRPLPIERVRLRGRTLYFYRRCGKCGCEWESDEFPKG